MKLKVINRDFSVCKVADYSQVDLSMPYTFTGKTGEENSLVCLTENTPANTTECEHGWRGFYITGVLDFSLVGILAKIAALLAENGISIFAISTFNTDYILLKKEKEEQALEVLQAAGYELER